MITHFQPESPGALPFTSYFVAVDLSRTEHDLRPIVDCLSRYPDLLKVQASAWIVSVICSAEELFASLQSALPEGGRLWMSETAGSCGWIAGDYRTALQIKSRVRL